MNISEHFANNVVMAHKELQASQVHKRCFGEVIRNVSEDDEVEYSMNSSGHRSDEFTSTHNGFHILFTGCSTTLGEGLPHMQNWSGKLYKKISAEIDTSGYFNMSFLGGSVELITANIYKYIMNYGKPDLILMHMPETTRKVVHNIDGSYINEVRGYDSPERYANRWYAYNSLLALKQYCDLAGIKTLFTSWDQWDVDFWKELNTFDNFIPAYNIDIMMAAKNKDEKSSRFYNIARDNAHPGLMYSDGLANTYYKEIFKRWPELKG